MVYNKAFMLLATEEHLRLAHNCLSSQAEGCLTTFCRLIVVYAC